MEFISEVQWHFNGKSVPQDQQRFRADVKGDRLGARGWCYGLAAHASETIEAEMFELYEDDKALVRSDARAVTRPHSSVSSIPTFRGCIALPSLGSTTTRTPPRRSSRRRSAGPSRSWPPIEARRRSLPGSARSAGTRSARITAAWADDARDTLDRGRARRSGRARIAAGPPTPTAPMNGSAAEN